MQVMAQIKGEYFFHPITRGNAAVEMLKDDFSRLRPGVWVNDEIMNAFYALLDKETSNNIFPMSSFFMSKLARAGYAGVNKWLKGVRECGTTVTAVVTVACTKDGHGCIGDCIFSRDAILLLPISEPLNRPPDAKGTHWTLGVIDFAHNEARYYDT